MSDERCRGQSIERKGWRESYYPPLYSYVLFGYPPWDSFYIYIFNSLSPFCISFVRVLISCDSLNCSRMYMQYIHIYINTIGSFNLLETTNNIYMFFTLFHSIILFHQFFFLCFFILSSIANMSRDGKVFDYFNVLTYYQNYVSIESATIKYLYLYRGENYFYLCFLLYFSYWWVKMFFGDGCNGELRVARYNGESCQALRGRLGSLMFLACLRHLRRHIYTYISSTNTWCMCVQ